MFKGSNNQKLNREIRNIKLAQIDLLTRDSTPTMKALYQEEIRFFTQTLFDSSVIYQ